MIILDHSIQLGSAKILLIYGFRSSSFDFSRALSHRDLVPLRIKVQDKWTGLSVRDELMDLEKEIGKVSYAVADFGSELKKGLALAGIDQIHDLSHLIALELEKRYLKDKTYLAFTAQLSQMRTKLAQTPLAHLIPIAARKKSIFQNLGKTVKWADKFLQALYKGRLNPKEKQALLWLKEYEDFLRELTQLNKMLCSIEKIFKNKGLTRSTLWQCNALINQHKHRLSVEGQQIIEHIRDYAGECVQRFPGQPPLLFTSDIIESAFGKYKNFCSDNKMACVTKMVLSLAAITADISPHRIMEMFEKVKLKDIDQWEKDHIGTTSLKKRIHLMSAA